MDASLNSVLFQPGRSKTCVTAIALMLCSCGDSRSTNDPVSMTTWDDVSPAWVAPMSASLYSLAFDEPAPNSLSLFLRAFMYSTAVTDACDVFAMENYLQRSSERDDWVLGVHFSQATTGEYRVDPRDRVGSAKTTQVMIKHIVRGVEVERHTGVGGSLNINSAPSDISEQQNGAGLTVEGSVEFSVDEARQISCSSVSSVDSGLGEVTCTCERRDGSSFTCIAEEQGHNCCVPRDGLTRSFPVAFKASPCAAACVTTSFLLTPLCNELAASGGS